MPSMPPRARLSGIEIHDYNQDKLCHYLLFKKKQTPANHIPRLGDSNTHPQHLILWKNTEN